MMNINIVHSTLKAALVSKGVPSDEIDGHVQAMVGDAIELVRASMVESAQKSTAPNVYQFQVKAMSDLLAWAKARA